MLISAGGSAARGVGRPTGHRRHARRHALRAARSARHACPPLTAAALAAKPGLAADASKTALATRNPAVPASSPSLHEMLAAAGLSTEAQDPIVSGVLRLAHDAAEHSIMPATAFPLALRPPAVMLIEGAKSPAPPAVPPARPTALIGLVAVLVVAVVTLAYLLFVRTRQQINAPANATPAPAAESPGGPAVAQPEDTPVARPTTPPAPASPGKTGRRARSRVEQIGKITVNTGALLGLGSHGTAVFKV